MQQWTVVHRMTETGKSRPAAQLARKSRTRDALVQAGRRLFAGRPVETVSIDELVLAAGVAKGSFYNHFADRDALAHSVAGEIRAELDARVELVNAGIADPALRLARGLAVYFRYGVDEPSGAASMARIHGPEADVESPENRLVVADLKDGIAQARFLIPTLEVGLMLVLALGMAGLLRVVREPSPTVVVSITQQLVMVALRGLGVPGDEAGQIAAQAADAVVRERIVPA
jgi:AcrR family transcriptional regulator